jgi:hypothetical protein
LFEFRLGTALEGNHEKDIEKIFSEEYRRVLGIVTFGGAEGTVGSTGEDYSLVFSISI